MTLKGPGFPIQISPDQSLLPTPRGFSQGATSFIAFTRQGIHQMPLSCLRETLPCAYKSTGKLRSRKVTTARKNLPTENPKHGPTARGQTSPHRQRTKGTGQNQPQNNAPANRRPKPRSRPKDQNKKRIRIKPAPEQTQWWRRSGSNRRPVACKATALPTELRPRPKRQNNTTRLVGPGRFELPTSRLSGVRSNQLSYEPRETKAQNQARPPIPDTWKGYVDGGQNRIQTPRQPPENPE